MPAQPASHTTEIDRHAGPGWLSASGIACLLGRHWPAAALSPGAMRHGQSCCADCGMPMERMADGGWQPARAPAWRGAGVGSR